MWKDGKEGIFSAGRRNPKGEGGLPPVRNARSCDASSVAFDDLLTDGETESGAFGPSAVEGFEDMRQNVRRNPRSVVVHQDFKEISRAPGMKRKSSLSLHSL